MTKCLNYENVVATIYIYIAEAYIYWVHHTIGIMVVFIMYICTQMGTLQCW